MIIWNSSSLLFSFELSAHVPFRTEASEHADLNFFSFIAIGSRKGNPLTMVNTPSLPFAARDYGKQEAFHHRIFIDVRKICRGLYCNSHLTRYVISFMCLISQLCLLRALSVHPQLLIENKTVSNAIFYIVCVHSKARNKNRGHYFLLTSFFFRDRNMR